MVFKLFSIYWLFNMQLRSFALYQYFEGKTRNGLFVVIAAAFVGRKLLDPLPVVLAVVLR